MFSFVESHTGDEETMYLFIKGLYISFHGSVDLKSHSNFVPPVPALEAGLYFALKVCIC